MGIEESYSRAILSKNLRDDEQHHDHEKLAAIAMASMPSADRTACWEHANLLFRIKYANDHTSFALLAQEWEHFVGAKAVLYAWKTHINYKQVASLSLEYWLNDICTECKGRRVVPSIGQANAVIMKECPACKGTAVKSISCNRRIRKPVTQMVEALNTILIHAGLLAEDKLRR